jgi:hypothetical protein
MFICDECRKLFEVCNVSYETHGLDTPPYEQILRCPYCLACNPSFAHRCSKCGEYTARIFDGYCGECKEQLKKEFRKTMEENFCIEDRRFLMYNALYDDDWAL